MKQKLLFLLISLLPSVMAWAAVGNEMISGGLKYTVTSESPKEVELTTWVEKPSGDLEIPAYVNGYAVTSIGNSAIFDDQFLTSVKIPEGVRCIGNSAFYYCPHMTSVTIPTSVRSIGEGAFSRCEQLKSIIIPEGVTSIEEQTFSLCVALTSVTIPSTVTSIEAMAFAACRSLPSITIPAAVTSIGVDAFMGCEVMTDVYMHADPMKLTWDVLNPDFKPNGSTLIHIDNGTDWSAFVGKVNGKFTYDSLGLGDEFNDGNLAYVVTSLSPATVRVEGCMDYPYGAVVIPATVGQFTVTAIADEAFYGLEAMTSVTIPETVTSIGADAFNDCIAVTDVYCYADPTALTWYEGATPDDFKEDGSTVLHVKKSSNWSAFEGKLNVIFSKDIISEVGERFTVDKLSYEVTSVSPKTVELWKFDSPLTGDVVIPAVVNGWTVTSIAAVTFIYASGITSVTIPETVTNIGRDAFRTCTGITDVYCNADLDALIWDEKDCDDFKEDGSTRCHVTDAEAWQTKFGGKVNVTFVENVVAVTLDDATPYTQTTLANVSSATYKKTISDDRVGKYQAWLVPFDYTITEDDEQLFQFYKINMIANAPSPGESSASGDMWVFLTKIGKDDVLRANMPYVYKPKQAVSDYEFTTLNAELQPKETNMLAKSETMEDIYRFYGTYENTTATGSAPFYYVNASGSLSYGTSVTVGPYRWIIRRENKFGGEPYYAREMIFVTDDETTGVKNINVNRDEDGWYTLDGRKLSGKPSAKGIYIRSGRKEAVR